MIQVSNLSFTYPGSGEQTIKGISFAVEKGEIFGFLGPSGAGKTTTQKILIGLLKNYQGRIEALGRNLKEWKADYYEKVGVSFELPNHYLKLTALENLIYFRSLYAGKTEEPQKLLEMVGLEDSAGMRVSQFSKGMKIRLNFARALLHRPELIFLDEPTVGLDPVNGRRIKNIVLEKKREGSTVFLTTHDMTVASELCDRVAFIINGEITLIDSPRNLMLQYGKRMVRVEYYENKELAQQEFSLDDLGDNAEFLKVLKEKQIQTIHTEEATLENIFIQVTGRSLS